MMLKLLLHVLMAGVSDGSVHDLSLRNLQRCVIVNDCCAKLCIASLHLQCTSHCVCSHVSLLACMTNHT